MKRLISSPVSPYHHSPRCRRKLVFFAKYSENRSPTLRCKLVRQEEQTDKTDSQEDFSFLSLFLSPLCTRQQGLVKCIVQKKEGTEMQRQNDSLGNMFVQTPSPPTIVTEVVRVGARLYHFLPGMTCQILITWSFGDPVQVG